MRGVRSFTEVTSSLCQRDLTDPCVAFTTAALELARQDYWVLLTSRDPSKGQKVMEELKAQSGNDALELFVGDLSSMDDVRRIALEVREKHPKLDALVNNAGGLFNQRQTTIDGFEYTFAFNHLAYFL